MNTIKKAHRDYDHAIARLQAADPAVIDADLTTYGDGLRLTFTNDNGWLDCCYPSRRYRHFKLAKAAAHAAARYAAAR
jgi:hypothetical protein